MSLDDAFGDLLDDRLFPVLEELVRLRAQIADLQRPRIVLSVAEAADALGVSDTTVYALIADGLLPTVDGLGPRTTRIPVSAIEELPTTKRTVRLRSAS